MAYTPKIQSRACSPMYSQLIMVDVDSGSTTEPPHQSLTAMPILTRTSADSICSTCCTLGCSGVRPTEMPLGTSCSIVTTLISSTAAPRLRQQDHQGLTALLSRSMGAPPAVSLVAARLATQPLACILLATPRNARSTVLLKRRLLALPPRRLK